MTPTQLDDARRVAADQAFEDYDFGYQVADASGWEYDSGPGGEWIRPVFFENDEDPAGASIRGTMTVHFEQGSDAVKEVWATVRGEIVGKAPSPAAAP